METLGGRHCYTSSCGSGDSRFSWTYVQIGFFLSLTYALLHWCIKMSILLLYIRAFTLHVEWLRIAVFVTMAYTTGWALAMVLFVPLQW